MSGETRYIGLFGLRTSVCSYCRGQKKNGSEMIAHCVKSAILTKQDSSLTWRKLEQNGKRSNRRKTNLRSVHHLTNIKARAQAPRRQEMRRQNEGMVLL